MTDPSPEHGGTDRAHAVGIVVLAAGASTRMGEAKQLLCIDGMSLLSRSLQVARAMPGPVVVVLGASFYEVLSEAMQPGVTVAENPEWEEGISSSIRAGLRSVLAVAPTLEAVIFMLCDQPFVTSDLLSRIVRTYLGSDAPIVASEYAGKAGVPALFDRSLFPRLLDLYGTQGAKSLLEALAEHVVRVPFPEGVWDIDTPRDFGRLGAIKSRIV